MIFQAYHRNDLARLRFSQYKMKQAAVAKLGNLIIGTRPDGSKNNALIAIGATHFSGSSPIKGHGRVPHKALCAYLKDRATFIRVSEDRSTATCCFCGKLNFDYSGK